jgi:shikimate dehydrogenase
LFLALPAAGPEDLDLLLTTFPELRGLAVTKPMKEHAAARADRFLERPAATLGAVNTLVATREGWAATNTDLLAMIELLKDAPKDAVVRVLGYGGLGKAVVEACRTLGLTTEVCNRTATRVTGLPATARALPWADRHREGAKILVQATSAGMAPAVELSPMNNLPASLSLVIETIYNPAETRLLAMARSGGVRTVDGRALFAGQAALQSTLFTDRLNAD